MSAYSEYQTLLLEVTPEGIAVVTLNRPERANSMTVTMFDEFSLLARELTADQAIRCVVITGAGSVFCPGYDIDKATELSDMTVIEFLNLQENASTGLQAIRALRVPVIAAVNGAAAGGGLSLALVADIRLADPSAKFSAAFSRIGLSAGDLGASWLLTRLVGPGVAAELAFTGRLVLAEEAARIGLVNSVSEAGAVLDDGLAMARLICANSPAGVRVSKSALRLNQEINSYAAASELENRGQALLTRTSDMPEALAAFRERRPANFTGN